MKAEEFRKEFDFSTELQVQKEIAAQLAELNDNLKSLINTVKPPQWGGPR